VKKKPALKEKGLPEPKAMSMKKKDGQLR